MLNSLELYIQSPFAYAIIHGILGLTSNWGNLLISNNVCSFIFSTQLYLKNRRQRCLGKTQMNGVWLTKIAESERGKGFGIDFVKTSIFVDSCQPGDWKNRSTRLEK